MPTVYMKNIGSKEMQMMQDGKMHNEKEEWNADYDGNKAIINLKHSKDGKTRKKRKVLSNKDLEKLFVIPAVDKSISKRIEDELILPSRGRGERCRPMLIPVDMNDPLFNGQNLTETDKELKKILGDYAIPTGKLVSNSNNTKKHKKKKSKKSKRSKKAKKTKKRTTQSIDSSVIRDYVNSFASQGGNK